MNFYQNILKLTYFNWFKLKISLDLLLLHSEFKETPLNNEQLLLIFTITNRKTFYSNLFLYYTRKYSEIFSIYQLIALKHAVGEDHSESAEKTYFSWFKNGSIFNSFH